MGTAEILATLILVDRERMTPGDSAPAQLYLAEPAIMTWNQPFVVRSESPVVTIGGGHVLVRHGFTGHGLGFHEYELRATPEPRINRVVQRCAP